MMRMLPKGPRMYGRLSRYASEYGKHDEADVYRFIQDCFTAFMEASGIDFEVAGADNIPLKGGFVLYPNHQSFLDIPAVVLGCPRPIAAVMKKELASMPVVKQLAAATGSHCLDREDDKRAIKVIRDVSAEVKAGRGYLVFPEGTRSRTGELLNFKAGSFKCVTRAKRPIVPVAIEGTRDALSSSSSSPWCIRTHFLEPIAFEHYEPMSSREIAGEVKSRIAAQRSKASSCSRITEDALER